MNKMILLLALFLLLLTNLRTFSQDISCSEYNDDCGIQPPPVWVETYKDIILDQYPQCTIRVYYKYRQCSQPPAYTTQWIITSIYFNNYASCMTLLTWLTNNNTGITSDKIRDLKTMIIEKVSLTDFEAWYNNAPTWAQEYVSCESGGGHYKKTYFQKSCSKVCYATFDNNGVVSHSLTEVECMDYDECCGVTYKYCKDVNGTTVVTREVTGYVSNCFVSPWFDTSGCPENATDLQILWCTDNCFTE